MSVPRVRRVVTSRAGGRSTGRYASFNLSDRVGDDAAAVAANRTRLAASISLPLDRVVWLEQVHGAEVATVDAASSGPVPGVDAAVTATPALALAVLIADCVPVLLADPQAGVVAAVHAGRAGSAAGIMPRAVEAMRAAGAELAGIDALLGPAICGACYEVPAEMRDEVETALPGSASTTRRGTPALDLRSGLVAQLGKVGVVRIVVDPRCTAEDPELYSHRRDGVTGRQAGVIWLDPSPAG